MQENRSGQQYNEAAPPLQSYQAVNKMAEAENGTGAAQPSQSQVHSAFLNTWQKVMKQAVHLQREVLCVLLCKSFESSPTLKLREMIVAEVVLCSWSSFIWPP